MARTEKNDLTFYKGANELFSRAFALIPEYIFSKCAEHSVPASETGVLLQITVPYMQSLFIDPSRELLFTHLSTTHTL